MPSRRKLRITKSRDRRQRFCVAISIYVIVAAIMGIRLQGPRLMSDEQGQLSGKTAYQNIVRLLGDDEAVHETGSAANDRLRQQLVEELESLGLEVFELPGSINDRSLTNILARRPGFATPRPILFSTHYDSCRFGPGAGDAMSCVAAILESIRWANIQTDVTHEYWYLFTDGEEAGMLGAKIFVRDHMSRFPTKPIAFNFDARGCRGPSLMFQTSKENYGLASAIVANLGQPNFTSSLMVSVYRTLPNDTDFSVFLKHGMAGLNFALIFGAENYHTPEDTPENLDPRSVQHIAEHCRAILLACEAIPEGSWDQLTTSQAATYFDLLGGPIIRYPQYLDVAFIVLAVALILCGIVRLRSLYGNIGAGVTLLFVSQVLLLFVAGFLGYGLALFFQTIDVLDRPFVQGGLLISMAYALVVLLVAFGFGEWIAARVSLPAARSSVAMLFCILAILTFFNLKGAAYIFYLPALLCGFVTLYDSKGYSVDFVTISMIAILWTPHVILFSAALGPNAGTITSLVTVITLFPTCVLFAGKQKRTSNFPAASPESAVAPS